MTILNRTNTIPPEARPYKLPAKTPTKRYHRKDDNPTSDEEPKKESRPRRRHVTYESPRCKVKDEEIFPQDHAPYQTGQRWVRISEQAGGHRQDGSVLTIRRSMTPEALQNGMTKQAAARVRCLNLWLDHKEDLLPEWLDAIALLFVNLEHFSLSEDIIPEEELAVSARMRRLYVLYRLPDLKSIDDMLVTKEERKMARPEGSERLKVEPFRRVGPRARKKPPRVQDHDDKENFGTPSRKAPLNPTERASMMDECSVVSEDMDVDTFMEDVEIVNGNKECTPKQTTISPVPATSEIEMNQEVDQMISELESQNFTKKPPYVETAVRPLGSNRTDLENRLPDLSPIRPSVCGSRLDADGHLEKSPREFIRRSDQDTSAPARPQYPLSFPATKEDKLEIMSVASSSYEWTASCGGVFAFRGDRPCVPRLNFGMCGAKESKNTTKEVSVPRLKAQLALDKSAKEKVIVCPAVKRNREVHKSAEPKFFPDEVESKPVKRLGASPAGMPSTLELTANERLPPSESLSSPFPIQFRNRTAPARIPSRLSMEVESGLDEIELARSDEEAARKNISPSIPGQKRRATSPVHTVGSPVARYRDEIELSRSMDEKVLKSCEKPSVPNHDENILPLSTKDEIELSRSLDVDTISHQVTLVRPAASPRSGDRSKAPMKGELPPTCPRSVRQKVPAAPNVSRKERRMKRQIKAARATARAISVLDDEDVRDLSDEEVELCADDTLVEEEWAAA